jgi:Tfp pilus assembly protein PilV
MRVLPAQFARRSRLRAARGFTLVEAAIATVIIGVAFTAMLNLLAVGTMVNNESTELTTAVNLAGNIHEASIRTAYDDLFDLEATYSPAVDSRLQAVSSISGWSQVVDVTYVDDNNLKIAVADNQYQPTARVSVTVRRNNKDVYRTSWLAAASE